MSPIYEYRCPSGCVTELFRPISERTTPTVCACGQKAELSVSLTAKRTDGIYSYAPNVGSEQKFERHREAIREGRKVIDGEHDS